MTTYTARALSTNRLQFVINQTLHGFAVGDLVVNNALLGPPVYVHAKADSVVHSQGVMMISFLIDADNFVCTQVGHVSNITSQTIVAGTLYYLSAAVANTLTTIAPSVEGEVVIPCFVADSTTSGFFFGGSGTLIGQTLKWSTVAVNTNMEINNGYWTNSGGTLVMTLPATASVGDRLQIGAVTGAFRIDQAAGQYITVGVNTTTPGVGGNVLSTTNGASISLVCKVAGTNTGWQADVAPQGTYTIT